MKLNLLAFFFLFFTMRALADPFTPGNIVVVRIGNGITSLSSAAQIVFLDEYTPCGSLVQSIQLPVAVSGANKRLTLPMYDVTEGYLTLSRDGQHLVLAGYDAAPGTASVSTSTSASINRVIGLVGMDGSVNTSTAPGDAFSGTVIRSAAADSNRIWMAGGSQGIRYTTAGSTSSTLIASTTGRYISIADSGLYLSSTAGSIRMARIGSGLPVTGSQPVTALPGFPVTGSPYQFFLADMDAAVPGVDVLYVAEDGAKVISKYSLVAGSWVANGSLGVTTDIYRGITGKVAGGNVILYAVRRNSNTTKGGSQIVTLTDSTGYNNNINGSFELVATADSNTIFRGIVLLPEAPAARKAAVKADTSLSLSLSPNPVSDQLRIRYHSEGAAKPAFFIYSSTGQLVKTIGSCNTSSGQLLVSVKGWTKGVYYVNMTNGRRKVTRKLLVQ
ncbi:T9SS type A sorting domain-containing protein [Filimonas effusa]|uniref:T9SS type A sorting domain-containing protein n=1 Tax=Filimonas effusa TaxID=2508721 RepID=A0A4Q1D057_9BACT|nr:T9SS type A sorting domain-containing protein [Filimonas effusa]RXK80966.1 T9SS type A sorting domain-containing protein [Filimonas effusa]